NRAGWAGQTTSARSGATRSATARPGCPATGGSGGHEKLDAASPGRAPPGNKPGRPEAGEPARRRRTSVEASNGAERPTKRSWTDGGCVGGDGQKRRARRQKTLFNTGPVRQFVEL